MKTLLSAVLLLGLLAWSHSYSFSHVFAEEWESFKLHFNKKYKSATEENFRKKIFAENKVFVAQHNQLFYNGEVSFTTKVNKYSDMLPQEFFSTMNGILYNKTLLAARNDPVFIEPDDDIGLPSNIDWREKGAVTEIKDQGACGSCWAFSTTGALEGQNFRKNNKLVSLSEQNLIDCSTKNSACEGGLMDYAFDFIAKEGGIDTEESYPYLGVDGNPCMFKKSKIGATDKGHVDIYRDDENALKKAVATVGPIAVAIDASHESFMSYSRGVYYNPDCDSDNLDHGVLAVGYGTTEDGTDYWLVKNSWGDSWGDKGYVKMARNRNNNCGIARMASYPLV